MSEMKDIIILYNSNIQLKCKDIGYGKAHLNIIKHKYRISFLIILRTSP